jgi:hypothetical protein
MSEYLDVGQFKQTKGGKWRFVRLGSAKKNDKGQLDVWLDALPIPDAEGQCRLSIAKRQERDGGKFPGPNDNVPMPHGLGSIDDEIPF